MTLPSPKFTPTLNLTPRFTLTLSLPLRGGGKKKNSVRAMVFETKSGAGEGVWVM